MAGHDDAQGVASDGRADGAAGRWSAQLLRQRAVVADLTVWYVQQGMPYRLLKGGACAQVQRQIKSLSLPCEVSAELLCCSLQQGVVRAQTLRSETLWCRQVLLVLGKPGTAKACPGAGQQQGPQRAVGAAVQPGGGGVHGIRGLGVEACERW